MDHNAWMDRLRKGALVALCIPIAAVTASTADGLARDYAASGPDKPVAMQMVDQSTQAAEDAISQSAQALQVAEAAGDSGSTMAYLQGAEDAASLRLQFCLGKDQVMECMNALKDEASAAKSEYQNWLDSTVTVVPANR